MFTAFILASWLFPPSLSTLSLTAESEFFSKWFCTGSNKCLDILDWWLQGWMIVDALMDIFKPLVLNCLSTLDGWLESFWCSNELSWFSHEPFWSSHDYFKSCSSPDQTNFQNQFWPGASQVFFSWWCLQDVFLAGTHKKLLSSIGFDSLGRLSPCF